MAVPTARVPVDDLGSAAFDMAPAPTVARGSAVAIALSKVGRPYRYGATGPNAFDCAGLVVFAFKQAGVSLPRASRAQSRVGTPVSRATSSPATWCSSTGR